MIKEFHSILKTDTFLLSEKMGGARGLQETTQCSYLLKNYHPKITRSQNDLVIFYWCFERSTSFRMVTSKRGTCYLLKGTLFKSQFIGYTSDKGKGRDITFSHQ